MYTKTVRLPYTLWYDGKDKTFRMDMSSILPEEHYEDGKKYIGKIRNVQVGGYNVDGDIHPPKAEDNGYKDVSEFATAVYNEQKHYVDITLKSFPSFNADGEIALYIDYELAKGIEEYLTDYSYKKEEVHIIIPIRSHENPSKDPGQFNNGIGIDKLDVRNGFAHTVGANEEPIVFSFELIQRDITDEFITNGQALDMVKNKAVEHVSLTAKDSGLELSLNYNITGNISWDNLKQYLGGEGGTVDTESIKNSILSAIQQQLPNAATIKQEILADVNPRIPDKESLKTSIIDQFLNTNFLNKAMNRGAISAHDINELLLNGPDESNEVTNTILGNFEEWQKHIIFIKHDDYYEVAYHSTDLAPRMLLKIPFSELREATGGAITLDSILEALKDDTKENVLTQIKEKLSIVNTDTLKHELLNALPAKDDYNLSYDGVSLYLTKTNDSSYMKSVQITPEINIEKINAEVLTSKLKPELDKSYYSKQEVDQLIQQLKHELMSEDHSEEHPQQ